MSQIKLVATDVDGTILKPGHKEFSPAVVNCIKELQNNGIKVALISGRMNATTKHLAEQLDLKSPIGSYQGALVVDNTNGYNALYQKNLDPILTREILDWANKNHVHLHLYMNDELYLQEINTTSQAYIDAQIGIKYHIKNFKDIKLENVNKLLIIDNENPDKVTEYREFLSKKYPELYIIKSTNWFCEVCNKEAKKANALMFLQEYWGISQDETLSIGDHDNDISLLEAGGIKVAMGNATDELKKIATYVTDTVTNDGFVKAIEKFVGVKTNV